MPRYGRLIFYSLGVGLALVGAGILALWLAGLAYVAMQGQWPAKVPMTVWIDLWRWSEASQEMRQSLTHALFIAGLAVLLLSLCLVQMLTRKPSDNLHGRARFASMGEIRQRGLFGGSGVIVGQVGGRFLRFSGEEFVILAAPTRTGKGVAVVAPNLLDYPHSVVVVDIKLEHFHLTSAYRQSIGQTVFLFNPFATDGHTHRWNPLHTIRREGAHCVRDILAIAHILYPQGHKKEAFWNDQARNLFLGLVLFIMETRPEHLNLSEVLIEVSGRGEDPRDYLRKAALNIKSGPHQEICRDALTRFCLTSENTFTSILATFNAPLTIFADPRVAAATRHTDIRLEDLRRQRMSLYMGIGPADLSQGAVLLNLLVSRLIQLNVETQPADDPSLEVPCLLILDEFAALGRIDILAKASAYIASFGLRLLTVIQSHAQLEALYGHLQARTIRTNHALQIHFAPREHIDAAGLSERLGYFDMEATTRSQSQGYHSQSRSQSTSRQRRALRLPQELQAMDSEDCLVVLDGIAPIEAKKAFYYRNKIFLLRLGKVSAYLAGLGKRRFSQQELNQAARRDLFVNITPIKVDVAGTGSVQPSDKPSAPLRASAEGGDDGRGHDVDAGEAEARVAHRRPLRRPRQKAEIKPDELRIITR